MENVMFSRWKVKPIKYEVKVSLESALPITGSDWRVGQGSLRTIKSKDNHQCSYAPTFLTTLSFDFLHAFRILAYNTSFSVKYYLLSHSSSFFFRFDLNLPKGMVLGSALWYKWWMRLGHSYSYIGSHIILSSFHVLRYYVALSCRFVYMDTYVALQFRAMQYAWLLSYWAIDCSSGQYIISRGEVE